MGALIVCAAVAAGCGDDSDDGGGDADEPVRLVVSAAASMTAAIESCAPRFEEEQNGEVRLSFAGSDELAAQIRQGAKVDVYAAANTRLPDELSSEKLLSEPVEFATNEFVLAVPGDSDIDSVEGVAEEGTKLVIGSESVPIGAYTRTMLARLPAGQEKAILANVRSNEPDVKGVVGKLIQGAADAGFVYATDVAGSGGRLRAIALPRSLQPVVIYKAAVVSGAKNPGDARQFVDGLRSGRGQDALREAGFGPAK